MIYTLTPNPALDLGGTVDRLIPNEKSYVYDEVRYPGGNAINAARIIHRLGEPVTAGGFLGGGTGQEVKDLLKAEGVRCDFVTIRAHTRISVTVSDLKSHLQTRLSFPGPDISPGEDTQMIRWISRLRSPSLLVVGGSLPHGFPEANLKALLMIARRRKIPFVVDVPGRILKQVIDTRPFLIKPNLIEFQELIGKKVSTCADVTREVRKRLSKVPLVCVSSVEGGALLISQRGTWFGHLPRLQVKSTVGAGDSMVGAMSSQISKLSPEHAVSKGEDLLRWGLAAAAATLCTRGTTLGELPEIRRYFQKVVIKSLSFPWNVM